MVAPNGSVYMFGGWERSQTAAEATAAAEDAPMFPVMPVRCVDLSDADSAELEWIDASAVPPDEPYEAWALHTCVLLILLLPVPVLLLLLLLLLLSCSTSIFEVLHVIT